MAKAVFLDKDGTLIPDIPYNISPELITLEEFSVDGLKRLQEKGYKLIVISNQAGIAKGFFKEEAIEKVKFKVTELLAEQNVHLDGFYYCPHHPDGTIASYAIECNCRKPGAGMFFKAAEEYGIDLNQSWMIGDILHDIEAGKKAGCKTILINNGNETEWFINDIRIPDFKAKNINEAADYILK